MTLDQALAACPIIAILRGVRPDEVVDIASALYEAGVRAVETPLNSPEPLESGRRLAEAFGERMCVGAGTVLTAAEVDEVAQAGGRLIVSPNTDGAVIRRALALGLECAPGFASATEAFAAIAAGARTLKLFPASTYGPQHLKALMAVTPSDVRVIAVGGVGPSAFSAWREAGAAGFGLGSELYKRGASAEEVAAKARACIAAL